MSINVNNNVSSIDTKRLSKQSAAASAPPSKTSKGRGEVEDPDTAETTVSAAARQLQESTSASVSNNVGMEAGSAPDAADTPDQGYWLDLATSVKNQILQQSSSAMLAQAKNLPQQALALIGG